MRSLLALAAPFLVFAPTIARAQGGWQSGRITDTIFDGPDLGPLADPKQPGIGLCVLGFFCELSLKPGEGFVYAIIRLVASFIGIAMVVIILYGAARILLSLGNDEGVKKGRSAILAGIIGFIIVLLAYGAVRALTSITS